MTAPIFGRIAEGAAAPPGEESFQALAGNGGARVERIASNGLREGGWYDQPQPEFVLLLQGRAELGFADGAPRRLEPGDWVLLPAHCRHRVIWTDEDTLWLAVHLPA